MEPKYQNRIEKMQQALTDQGIDAFFASTPVTMGYLANFHEGGWERMLLLGIAPNEAPAMLIPALSHTQAQETTGLTDLTTWSDGEDPGLKFADWADRWGLRTGVIAVDDEMSASYLLRMQQALPAALFKPGTPLIEACRGRKDAWEMERMEKASAAVDKAYLAIQSMIKPGATEREIQSAIHRATVPHADSASFAIVASGPNGAKPHYLTGDVPVQEGDVIVMDFGATVDGYQADITRTVCVGKASDDAKKIYRIVLAAHNASRAAAKPGVPAQEVDRAGRKKIADAGFGDYFVHRTGHGIGLQVHEPPFMVEGNESPLQEGNCFTVEPGIYLPGKLGVRIENVCAITSDGCRSLNADAPTELPEL